MSKPSENAGPAFYTVREAARVLRVAPSTLYRAIREDAFPAVRVRSRYVVPARCGRADGGAGRRHRRVRGRGGDRGR